MKKYLFILLALTIISTINAQEDAVAKYMANYILSEDFEHTYVSNRMFSAILKSNANEIAPNVRELLKDIKGMRQLNTKKDTKKYFDEVAQTLEKKGFENVLSIRRGNERVHMYLKNENKSDGELIMLIQESNSFNLTGFNGNINLDNMSTISKALNIKGAEYIPQARKK
jgi:hypothetical protein